MTSKISTKDFASAATPLSEDTIIITDTSGLVAGPVEVAAADRAIPAYRAAPDTAGPHPVVLVVQEIFGVHEHIKDVCRRFAKLGYLAIAPELYVRQGDVAPLPSIDEIRKVVAQVPDEQVLSDLDACVAWAANNGGDTGRLGVTGFCWGGRIVWLYAAHQPRLKAGVAWYGRLAAGSTPLQPTYPVDLAAQLKAPVLGLYGGEDQGIPLETVEKMRTALQAVKSPSTIHVYDGAPHAFYADYRPSYRPDAAQDGWQRLQAWFKQHGV
jgi:carboxymethylenebutenolidase